MPFCLTCEKRKDCKKICPELEKILPKVRSGGNEKEFSTGNIEEVATKWAFNRKGKRKLPKIYNDNWELD